MKIVWNTTAMSFNLKSSQKNNSCHSLWLTAFLVLSIISLRSQTTFTESAAAYNLNIGGNKDGGHAWADYDLDGDFDLVVNRNGNARLMRNDGGSFTDVTTSLAPNFNTDSFERTVLFVDFNNDGYPDLFRNTAWQFKIYLQDPATNRFGNGTGGTSPSQHFTSLTDGMNTEGAGALDYDGDGDLDIFIDNHNYGIDILQNDGNGFFTHVTRKSDSPNPPYNVNDPNTWPLGLVQDATDGDYGSATDYNDDGWVDIVVRKRNQVDLFENNNGVFQNGVDIDDANNGNKGAVAFGDLDNDGDFDLYWTENGTNQIHRNNGDGTWTGLGASTGIPINFSGQIEGLAFGDVDNDGDLDIFLTGNNTSRLYLNQVSNGGGVMSFVDSGLSFTNRGEGCTFIDIDNDGDLDLYMNRSGNNALYINNLGSIARANHLYINIIEDRDDFGLINTEERFGIGSTVKIIDCNGNVISGTREVNGGYGHGTQGPGIIHFGLPGGPNTPVVLEISYPSTTSGRVIVRSQVTPSNFNNGSINLVDILPDVSNLPPIAQDDNISTNFGTSITFNALIDNGNGLDSDPEGNPIEVIAISQPANGSAVLNPDGSITYNPGSFVGTTFMTYTLGDNTFCSFASAQDTGTIFINVLVDNDLDGITDDVDLDDDNDGILDEIEALGCSPTDPKVDVTIFLEDFGVASGTRVSTPFTNYSYEDGLGSGSGNGGGDVNLNDGEYTIYEDISTTGSWAPTVWQSLGDHTSGSDRMMIVNADNTAGLEFYRRPLTQVVENVPLEISFWVMNIDIDNAANAGRTEPDITALIQQSGSTVYSFNTNSIPREPSGNPIAWKEFIGSFTPSSNVALELVLINNAPGGLGNDLALDDIKVVQIFCDSDGNGIPNSREADSDGDGCNDSDEAYGDLNADIDDNGMYGAGTPSVNPDGTVNIASYQTPADANSSGTFDFLEFGSPPSITSQPLDTTTCPGCSTSISAVADGDIYQWQLFNGSTWIDLSDSSIYSGTSSATLMIINPTNQENNNQYRVVISKNDYICSNTISTLVTLTIRVNTIITNRRITYRINKN